MSRLKHNYMYNLGLQFFSFLIPLITIPYITRVLGPSLLGDYDYTAGIVSYFGLIALTGTQHYGQREIAVRQQDKADRSSVFLEVLSFRLICIIASLVIYLLFTAFFLTQYRQIFAIQIITFVSWGLDISWYYTGVEKVKNMVIRNMIARIISTLMIFLLVRSKDNFHLYVVIAAGMTLLANALTWFDLRNEIDYSRLKKLNIRRHLKGIMELFIPVIAIQIYAVVDKTMLGSIINTTEVGYYAQAEKIVRLSLTVFTALMTVLIPRIAAVYAHGDKEEVAGYFNKALRYLAMISMPMMIGIVIIADRFVPLFFGAEFGPVTPLLQVLSLLFPILGTGHLIGGIMIAINRTSVYNRAVISAAVVNVIFNLLFLLAFRMGATGVAIATVIAEFVCASSQILVFKKSFSTIQLTRTFVHYLLPAAGMGAVVFALKQIPLSPVFSVIISVGGGGLFYLILLILMKDETVINYLNKAKAIIRRMIKK